MDEHFPTLKLRHFHPYGAAVIPVPWGSIIILSQEAPQLYFDVSGNVMDNFVVAVDDKSKG